MIYGVNSWDVIATMRNPCPLRPLLAQSVTKTVIRFYRRRFTFLSWGWFTKNTKVLVIHFVISISTEYRKWKSMEMGNGNLLYQRMVSSQGILPWWFGGNAVNFFFYSSNFFSEERTSGCEITDRIWLEIALPPKNVHDWQTIITVFDTDWDMSFRRMSRNENRNLWKQTTERLTRS